MSGGQSMEMGDEEPWGAVGEVPGSHAHATRQIVIPSPVDHPIPMCPHDTHAQSSFVLV